MEEVYDIDHGEGTKTRFPMFLSGCPVYKDRNPVKRSLNHIKRFRRLATRYEETVQ